MLDARLCISYHTIENRGPIPRELRSKFGDWIFGCDDCLHSCPVGAKNFTTTSEFVPADIEAARPELAPLLSLDDEAFLSRFRGRPIMRAKRDGFLRNVCVALGNSGTVDDLPPLVVALNDDAALVRGHASWALAEIGVRTGRSRMVESALAARLGIETDPWVAEELVAGLARLARG